MLRVLTSNLKDPLVKAFLELSSHERSVEVLTLNDLLKADKIWITTGNTLPVIDIEAYSSTSLRLLSWHETGVPVINRILDFPQEIFQDYTNEDRVYAQREIEAFVGGLLSIIRPEDSSVSTPIGIPWLQQALPEQWQKVKKIPGLDVPQYVWSGPGLGHTVGELESKDHWIEKDPHDFAQWRKSLENLSPKSVDFGVLRHERPKGEPVAVLVLNGEAIPWIENQNERSALKIIAQAACELLELSNGEMIFFKSTDSWTFGSATAQIGWCHQNWKEFLKAVDTAFFSKQPKVCPCQ
jgi:hypothetical protein